jgi:hypothetical protein
MYSPLYINPYDMYMMRKPSISFIRVLHASPDAPGVDVYANTNLIAKNLKYGEFTPYLKVPSGQCIIKVFPTGTFQTPLISTTILLIPNAIYTIAAIGQLANIGLLPIRDSRITVNSTKTNVRFVHLSPNAPAVDITLPDGTVLFPNVGYKGVTGYIPVNPGTYTLEARLAGTKTVVLSVPNVILKPGLNISIYAVGLAGGKPGLEVLIPLDGSSYL